MKKFLAAVCCTLLVASTSFAQSGSRVAPAAAAPAAAPVAEAVQAVTAAPAAVTQAPVDAVPMESGVVEGAVIGAPVAPMSTSFPMAAPIQQNCGCSGAVSAPIMSSAPIVMGSSDISQSVVAAPIVAAPMASSDCGCCGTPAPAPASASACCPQRRQPVRGFVSRLGSRRSACCCN